MQKSSDSAGLSEAHDHMLGEVVYPGNSLWHTGSGDLSVFNLFTEKHRELTTHAPGDQQNHDAKKVIEHVLNCYQTSETATTLTAWVNTLWRCVSLSACVVDKWPVDSDPEASDTHAQAHRDEQDVGISPETAHLQETNHHTAKKEFKERRIISEKSLIYITMLSSH